MFSQPAPAEGKQHKTDANLLSIEDMLKQRQFISSVPDGKKDFRFKLAGLVTRDISDEFYKEIAELEDSNLPGVLTLGYPEFIKKNKNRLQFILAMVVWYMTDVLLKSGLGYNGLDAYKIQRKNLITPMTEVLQAEMKAAKLEEEYRQSQQSKQ